MKYSEKELKKKNIYMCCDSELVGTVRIYQEDVPFAFKDNTVFQGRIAGVTKKIVLEWRAFKKTERRCSFIRENGKRCRRMSESHLYFQKWFDNGKRALCWEHSVKEYSKTG